MEAIFLSFVVSKLGKSNDVKDVQPENIIAIEIIVDKLKLVKFKDSNLLHFENIFPITETKVVFKLDKSNEVKEEQS